MKGRQYHRKFLQPLNTALLYLALFRPDAAIIAFLSYLVGVQLAGGAIALLDIGIAALVSLVSTNFIYTCNSVADWKEDIVAHPNRPIPSQRLSPDHARRYATGLLFISVLYPLLVGRGPTTVGLFLLLPILGLAYSAQPVRLRRWPGFAIVVISIGLVTPITLGALMTDPRAQIFPVTAALFMFCVSVVPLKAVEEVAEDQSTGRPNLYSRHGLRLFLWTAAGLSVMTAVAILKTDGPIRNFLVAAALCALMCMVLFSFKKNKSGIYATIILVVIFEGVVLFFFLDT